MKVGRHGPRRWSPALITFFPRTAPTFMPTHTQTLAGVEAFFDYVSAYLPFLHRPTFDVSVASLPLLLGVLSLGYQYTDDPDADFLPGSGETLSGRCFHRAVSILDSTSDDELLTRVDKLRHIQSCLLLEFCALIFLCGSHSVRGLRLHSRIIGVSRCTQVRYLRMMLTSPPTCPAGTLGGTHAPATL